MTLSLNIWLHFPLSLLVYSRRMVGGGGGWSHRNYWKFSYTTGELGLLSIHHKYGVNKFLANLPPKILSHFGDLTWKYASWMNPYMDEDYTHKQTRPKIRGVG